MDLGWLFCRASIFFIKIEGQFDTDTEHHMETPLKVGDSAILTTSLGHKYAVLILEVLEKGGY